VTPTKPSAACSTTANAVVATSGIPAATGSANGGGSTTASTTTGSSTKSTTFSTNKSSAGNIINSPLSLMGPSLGIYILGLVAIGGGAFML
jgi:hypothetical protein